MATRRPTVASDTVPGVRAPFHPARRPAIAAYMSRTGHPPSQDIGGGPAADPRADSPQATRQCCCCMAPQPAEQHPRGQPRRSRPTALSAARGHVEPASTLTAPDASCATPTSARPAASSSTLMDFSSVLVAEVPHLRVPINSGGVPARAAGRRPNRPRRWVPCRDVRRRPAGCPQHVAFALGIRVDGDTVGPVRGLRVARRAQCVIRPMRRDEHARQNADAHAARQGSVRQAHPLEPII